MTASQSTSTPVTRQVGAMTLTIVSDTEVMLERTFDAPRDLVFRAHASCEHISKWWGRRVDTMAACEMDFRPGGRWRFVNRDDQGNEIVFHGEYTTIIEPERIERSGETKGAGRWSTSCTGSAFGPPPRREPTRR